MRLVTMCTARALLITWAAACSPVPERSRHSVEDYRADAGLRDAQLALCANDPGTLARTPDCVNAKEAARQNSIRSLRDLPTVRLPAPTDQKGVGQADRKAPGSDGQVEPR